MRYAIVSDLHANLAAWQTVLTDLADLKADQIICLGDIVGYGPDPVEVLESVYRVVNVTVLGNHDAAACGRLATDTFSPYAATAAARHRGQLSLDALAWLAGLPLTYEGPGFRCAHGDFSEPAAFRYVIAPEDALPSWRATPEQLLFLGHSHLPGIYVTGESGVPHFVAPCDFELEAGKRYIINPGSVGYPRVGERQSSYCLYDDATRSILFRLLPFDSAAYRRAMHGAGLDDDPWVRQKEQQQRLPDLREALNFRKAGAEGGAVGDRAPSADRAAELQGGAGAAEGQGETRETGCRAPGGRRRILLWALAAAAGVAAGVAAFCAGGAAAPPSLAVAVPPFDLPSIAAYPILPYDKNLLPPLPPKLNPDGRLEGWRYAFEDRGKQRFSTGLRDGATTLCVQNEGPCKVQLESPLIDLAGTGLRAVRLQGRIRKPEPFSGTVFYQLVLYAADAEGPPVQRGVQPFEMRTSKRKLSTPGADRDVKIKLAKQVTHIRFRIEADFEGTLEIEQPRLTAVPEVSQP